MPGGRGRSVTAEDLAKADSIVSKAEAAREHRTDALKAAQSDLAVARSREATLQLATAFLQKEAQETQKRLKYHVQDLVQSALSAVFPGKYDFRMDFVPLRNRTEVSIYLDKDGAHINPEDASGGGVVDVVSFALRVVSWSLSGTSNTLFLDEPFKWVSVGLRPLCAELLHTLSERMNLQVVMVTHDSELVEEADTIFEVDQKRRRSIIVKRKGAKQ